MIDGARVVALIAEVARGYPEPGTCPACGRHGCVADSRPADGYIRRRRRCECGARWTTAERTTSVDLPAVALPTPAETG